ncbi:MAG: phosphoglycerate dehydrogenase [Syntrophomonadaceae bacterium]|nr:phosphoglycerate dehydrogenase [Syntrophomonadaceae bacterium]
MKVVVAERISDAGVEALRKVLDVDLRFGIKQDELLEIIEDYDALIVRSVIKVNEQLLSRAKKLKVVGRAGNGIDNIEVPAATRRGVLVVNTPESNTISAAEHTIGLLLSSIRNIPAATIQLKSGRWDRTLFKGVELYGKTVGIVGLGRIGSMVATRLASFGMKVLAYDPYITDERFRRFGAEKVAELSELVRRSDFITVHTPRTEETMGMIGEEQFKIAKRGVRVVNCARGGIINEAALIKAMEEGIVASAGLDVFEKEPSPGNPIFQLDKIAVTPHCGADTVEAQDRVGITIANQVIAALRGELVPNAVNLPTLQEEELVSLRPYLCLAEKMGKVYFQLDRNPVDRVEVTYSGRVADKDTEMITISFLKGLLEPIIGEKVNYVNAAMITETRGVKVASLKEEMNNRGYVNLITARVYATNTFMEISGTLTANREPRIVSVKGYDTDITPTENMLFVENVDRPGVIGPFACVLGEYQINIAMMGVGRRGRGEIALMTLNVDSEVDEEVVQRLREIDGITSVKVVKF